MPSIVFNKNKSTVYPLGQPASVLIIFEKLAHTPQQQNLIEIRNPGLRNILKIFQKFWEVILVRTS